LKIHIVVEKNRVVLTCDKLPNKFFEVHCVSTEIEEMLAVPNIKVLKRINAVYKVISELFKELGDNIG